MGELGKRSTALERKYIAVVADELVDEMALIFLLFYLIYGKLSGILSHTAVTCLNMYTRPHSCLTNWIFSGFLEA